MVFSASSAPPSTLTVTSKPPAVAGFGGEQGQVIADHFARHRIDRRLADGQYQTGSGHRADADTGVEANPRFGAQSHL